MLTLDDLILRPDASLRSAMERMTRNRKAILFICDEGEHLVGVLTDGDLRRALLEDALLVAPVAQAMNTDPLTARDLEEAGRLVRRTAALAVPVVDAAGRIREALVQGPGESIVLRPIEALGQGPAPSGGGAVALIPARGGSKRIPRKNLAVVAGRPLVAWAVAAAQTARSVGEVIVSTDDAEIADVVRAQGAELPWLRPAELCQDHTPALDVVVHALEWVARERSPAPEIAVLLEPTAPLRTGGQIDEAVELLAAGDADSVVCVCEVPHVFNPEEQLVIEDGLLRPYVAGRDLDTRRLRGQQRPAYVPNGLVYAFRVASVLEQRSLYGKKSLPLVVDWKYFLDVDTREDLELAQFRMTRPENADR